MSYLKSFSRRSLNLNKSKTNNIIKLFPNLFKTNISSISYFLNTSKSNFNNNTFNITYNNTKSLFNIPLRQFSNYPEHEVVGLPALSPSVETSKIVEWKKNVGDIVGEDEAIAVVQTDKAALDWRVTDEIYLAKILLEPDIEVPVNTPCAIFVENKDDVAAFANYTLDSSSSSSSSSSTTETSTTSDTSTTTTTSSSTTTSQIPSGLPEYRIEGMPALSPTAENGAIVEWLVGVGDKVEEGTEIAMIQTDKSAVAWGAIDDGYLAMQLYPADSDTRYDVNHPIAIFVENQEDVTAFKSLDPSIFLSGDSPSTETPSEPQQTTTSVEPSEPVGRTPSIQFTHGVRDTPQQQSTQPSSSTTTTTTGRIIASPYAKTLALSNGIDLRNVNGTGPNGRIVARDVEKAIQSGTSTVSTSTTTTTTSEVRVAIGSDRTFNDIQLTPMRSIIAQRLCESKFSRPHYYETIEIEMDNLMNIRKDINASGDYKISVNDFIIKACALSLRDVPDVNVSWMDKFIRQYNYIDISVAVATPSGLITPIIKDANLLGLSSISSNMKDLAARARKGTLNLEEFQGGTFTVSNLGMFGIDHFTAIINPPQSCILAVGGANQVLRPCDKNGYKTVTTMKVTLSSDHRTVDGALAAEWLKAFRNYMESPGRMLL